MAAFVSAALGALAFADQQRLGWTRQDVAAHYGRFGEHPDPNILTLVLLAGFAAAALTFATGAILAGRGRRTVALLIAGTGVLIGLPFAGLATFATEFHGHVLTMQWRTLSWAPAVLACLACGDLARRPTVHP